MFAIKEFKRERERFLHFYGQLQCSNFASCSICTLHEYLSDVGTVIAQLDVEFDRLLIIAFSSTLAVLKSNLKMHQSSQTLLTTLVSDNNSILY